PRHDGDVVRKIAKDAGKHGNEKRQNEGKPGRQPQLREQRRCCRPPGLPSFCRFSFPCWPASFAIFRKGCRPAWKRETTERWQAGGAAATSLLTKLRLSPRLALVLTFLVSMLAGILCNFSDDVAIVAR